MEASRKAYAGLQAMGVRNEDARYVLPNAVESQLVVSANLREWRHIIELRCRHASQWEIRQVCGEILRLLKKSVPTAFEDLELDEKGGAGRQTTENSELGAGSKAQGARRKSGRAGHARGGDERAAYGWKEQA
jgi:thymidylate synthase ThyX